MIRLCGTNKRNIRIFVCVVFEKIVDSSGSKDEVIHSIHLSEKGAKQCVDKDVKARRYTIKYLHIFD